jgi:imidazolonepropionase-like amidohydrolase
MNRRGLFRTTSHKTPGVLAQAGLKFALSTEHPQTGIDHLVTTAAIACREGMPEEEALKAITIYPAEILGLADQIGSIEKGKKADLVVWSGHPFETLTRVDKVLIGGQMVYERGN